jgi:hypothetical protein
MRGVLRLRRSEKEEEERKGFLGEVGMFELGTAAGFWIISLPLGGLRDQVLRKG